ncbi:hypothetical protein, partial [Sphingorhabdus sp.]|uniref:hypothetical protein n=1 Tax=Sphingorhabdus sp. TaxID=1902408 RepID=UPI0040471FB7
LRDLSHRIPLELIAKIYLAHLRLLTSNLGKKASRNLGAIQNDGRGENQWDTHGMIRQCSANCEHSR